MLDFQMKGYHQKVIKDSELMIMKHKFVIQGYNNLILVEILDER